MLGLDQLHVANEGRFVAFVASGDADKAVACLREQPDCEGAAVIGAVTGGSPVVSMTAVLGGSRIVDMLSGGQLPRIC